MNTNEYRIMYKLENSHWWFVGKRRFIEEALRLYVHSPLKKILDVGSGTGGTTKFLRGWGKVVGVEMHPLARSLAKKRGLRILPGNAQSLPYAASSVDMVTLFDVLYHKRVDEKKALKEAYRVLAPNGTLLVTDCAMPFFMGPHDEVMHARKRYTKSELTASIASAGFQVILSTYIYSSTFPLFVLSRLVAKIIPPKNVVSLPRPLFNTLLLSLVTLEAKLIPYFRLPYGSSILILARKL